MSREIKFRGKSVYTGEWLYGDFVQYAGTAQIWAQTDNGKWNCIVDPATVGQFTGFQDLYQGDICKDDRGNVVEVVWPDHHQWGGKMLKSCTLNRGLTFPLWQWDASKGDLGQKIERIGNRWDNPDLIGGGGNE